jgi:molybdopterin-guanine dinucleotide biosynthesis protein A
MSGAARYEGPFSGIVLAGGRATRMGGRDKAFVSVEGAPIFERIRRVIEPRVSEIVVVTPHGDRFPPDVRTSPDLLPDCGPLGGLHAGLSAAKHPYALVVACDMPFLSPALLDFILAGVSDEDAVVPIWEGKLQTLHAVYARRLAPEAERALQAGVRALHAFLSSARVKTIAEKEIARIPGAGASFTNLNAAEDGAP